MQNNAGAKSSALSFKSHQMHTQVFDDTSQERNYI